MPIEATTHGFLALIRRLSRISRGIKLVFRRPVLRPCRHSPIGHRVGQGIVLEGRGVGDLAALLDALEALELDHLVAQVLGQVLLQARQLDGVAQPTTRPLILALRSRLWKKPTDRWISVTKSVNTGRIAWNTFSGPRRRGRFA